MSNDFQTLLQKFFIDRLINQRRVSPCTINSYRDTFRIMLRFINEEKGIRANAINIEMLTAEMIIEFMNYLERTRNNKNKTINNRLAAINAFMDYVVYERPEYSGIAVRIKGIPYRNIEKNNVCYMTKQEIESILKSCDNECFLGRRDTVIILLLYNTGMRVSELTTVRNQDLSLENQTCATLRIMGKGRKERVVPLWEKTRKWLLKYLSETSCNENNYIFKSPGVDHLTRSGVRYRINEVVKKAGLKCPSLTKKTITPHVFRHSTAMHLLQAGIDLSTIAIWLGHENMDTTHKYMVADLALKEMAVSYTHLTLPTKRIV